MILLPRATLGFADRSGFRLGAADVVPAWDAVADRAAGIEEVPLHWMDRTSPKYLGIDDPADWIRGALEVAATAREAEGLWVGLWVFSF